MGRSTKGHLLLSGRMGDNTKMSKEETTYRKRRCCNCRHNIRVKEKNGYVSTHCELDNHSISYVQCFNGWCRHWASDERSRR